MQKVKAKKRFGQHFLKDESTAHRIVDALNPNGRYKDVLEIGAGMGILTQFLFERNDLNVQVIEIDRESVQYLQNKFPAHILNIEEGDFLMIDLDKKYRQPFAIIGNFPYNISSQILFRVLENKERIPEVVGMFQKEVAVRIASAPGNRDYGILSVLMQAYYEVEMLFMLEENDFSPPPKVKSSVLRFERKENFNLRCDETLFRKVVKTAFNQRRKTLRNALKPLINTIPAVFIPYLDQRAETLSWKQYEELTLLFQNNQ